MEIEKFTTIAKKLWMENIAFKWKYDGDDPAMIMKLKCGIKIKNNAEDLIEIHIGRRKTIICETAEQAAKIVIQRIINKYITKQ